MVDSIKYFVLDFLRSETGATAIEYGLIAALVAVSLVIALKATGSSLSSLFTYVANTITAATPTP